MSEPGKKTDRYQGSEGQWDERLATWMEIALLNGRLTHVC